MIDQRKTEKEGNRNGVGDGLEIAVWVRGEGSTAENMARGEKIEYEAVSWERGKRLQGK